MSLQILKFRYCNLSSRSHQRTPCQPYILIITFPSAIWQGKALFGITRQAGGSVHRGKTFLKSIVACLSVTIHFPIGYSVGHLNGVVFQVTF